MLVSQSLVAFQLISGFLERSVCGVTEKEFAGEDDEERDSD